MSCGQWMMGWAYDFWLTIFYGYYNLSFDDVKTNELHFVSMIPISWDKVNLQQLLLGLSKLQFVFHDEHVRLMFSFVQVMLYIATSRAFMGWASIPQYSFITTNWKQKTLCSHNT
jgi:hypothetical protein